MQPTLNAMHTLSWPHAWDPRTAAARHANSAGMVLITGPTTRHHTPASDRCKPASRRGLRGVKLVISDAHEESGETRHARPELEDADPGTVVLLPNQRQRDT